MPTLSTISVWLGEASLKWIFQKVAFEGTEGLKSWIISEAEKDNKKLTKNDLNTLNGVLEGSDTFFKTVWANLKPWTDAGVLIIGPSGSGKSSLCEFLKTGQLADPISSTTFRNSVKVRHEARKYLITDTAGQHGHVHRREDVTKAIRLGNERVLVIMMAGGFLKTEGIIDEKGKEILYKRPNQDATASLRKYLNICAMEEINWLESIAMSVGDEIESNRRFRYILIVVNKADQWWNAREHVRKYYTCDLSENGPKAPTLVAHLTYERSKQFKAAIDKVVKNFGVQDISPSTHVIASAYDSMYGHAPNGILSRQAVHLSMLLFRAELRLRFFEI